MFLNVGELEKAPELIPLQTVCRILNRKYSATYEFLKTNRFKPLQKGREKFITKTSLVDFLRNENALPQDFMKNPEATTEP